MQACLSIRFLAARPSFLDTAEALVQEAGPSLCHYDVCDNVDLATVLQARIAGSCIYNFIAKGALLACVCVYGYRIWLFSGVQKSL